MAPKFCSLLSGGKDSNYALYKALSMGWEPSCIVVVRPLRVDSWMFHTEALDAPVMQARAMGLEGIVKVIRVSGVKEREVYELGEGLKRIKRDVDFDVITVGALASEYQRRRIMRIASMLGVEVFAPAWGRDPESYMRGLVDEGFRFVIVRSSTWGLDWRHVGVPVEGEVLEDILSRARKYDFHPAFEGGEAETMVVHAPHYRMKLCFTATIRREGPHVYTLDISELNLAPPHIDDNDCFRVESKASQLGIE